jgi:hypothetical protein
VTVERLAAAICQAVLDQHGEIHGVEANALLARWDYAAWRIEFYPEADDRPLCPVVALFDQDAP